MNCPKCNKPNREKAVFCKWCGTNVVTKATEPLRELVGMETVKNQLQDLVNTCESLALRAQRSGIAKTIVFQWYYQEACHESSGCSGL